MKLATRTTRIVPSPTLNIAATAKAMVKQGIDVVDFSIGEPSCDTPAFVKAAAQAAIQAGFTKYTPVPGIDELREAIIEKFQLDQGIRYEKAQILVSCGAKHTLYHQAFEARIQPVGVTVPSIRPEEPLSAPGVSGISDGSLPEWVQSHISSRLLLNRLIEAACFAQKIPCVDLFSETAEGPHHLLAASFSSDGLHLSREGYERFAKIVWEQVFAAQFRGCGVTQGKPRPS